MVRTLVLALIVAGVAAAQDPPANKPLNPRVKYEAAIQALQEKFTTDARAAQAECIAKLDEILKVETARGDLDRVLIVQAEKKRVEEFQPTPKAITPTLLQQSRSLYDGKLSSARNAFDKAARTAYLELLADLDAQVREETKAGQIELALGTRELRKQMEKLPAPVAALPTKAPVPAEPLAAIPTEPKTPPPPEQVVVPGSNGLPVSGKLLSTSPPAKDPIAALVVSPDGTRLVAAHGKFISVLDARTGAKVADLPGHGKTVAALVFSPNGKVLVSGSKDETLKLWPATAQGAPRGLNVSSAVNGLAWARSADVMAVANGTLQLVEGESAKVLRTYELPSKGGGTFVRAVALAPNGKTIAAAVRVPSGATIVRIFDTTSDKPRTSVEGFDQVEFTPDGKLLLTAGNGPDRSFVSVFDTDRFAKKLELRGHTTAVKSLAISPSGRVVAAGAMDSTIRLWDLNTGTLLLTLQGHTGPVVALSFSPNGEVLYSGSGGTDRTIRTWKLQAKAP